MAVIGCDGIEIMLLGVKWAMVHLFQIMSRIRINTHLKVSLRDES